MQKKLIDVYLLSDSTGDTVQGLYRAVMAQFDMLDPSVHIWTLIRDKVQLEEVFATVDLSARNLIVYTLVDADLIALVEHFCVENDVRSVSVMKPLIDQVSALCEVEVNPKPGQQYHQLNEEYFDRIAAMEFNLSHDDGAGLHNVLDADVIILGVSRSSKTPTTMYLANRGIKAANIPFVAGIDPPSVLERVRPATLVVGLTRTPRLLSSIRRTRMAMIDSLSSDTQYDDLDSIREEVRQARYFFTRNNWPVIDVTHKSIEETAAEILQMLHEHRGQGH